MKKRGSLIAMLFFAISLSGCGGGKQDVQDVSKEGMKDLQSNVGTVAPKGSREECINGCVMLWKANKDNVSKPDEEMNKYCDQMCDAGQGIKNSDPASCAKGEGAYRDTCYVNVARDTVDASLCEKVERETLRAGCYRDVSAKNGDKSLCEKVTVSYIKDSCLKK